MFVLMAVTTNPSYTDYLQWALIAITLGGFLVATIIGSIAWYNSRRPVGWEDAETPSWVPRINTSKNSDDSFKK